MRLLLATVFVLSGCAATPGGVGWVHPERTAAQREADYRECSQGGAPLWAPFYSYYAQTKETQCMEAKGYTFQRREQ